MNSKIALTAAVAIVAVAAGAAVAGSGHKCDAGMDECLTKQAEHLQKRGWIGIEVDRDDTTGTLTISKVLTDTPAATAGFRTGDVLMAMNGIGFDDEQRQALYKAKKSLAVGDQVTYTVTRAGSKLDLTATLAPVPQDVLAQWIGQHALEHHIGYDVAQAD